MPLLGHRYACWGHPMRRILATDFGIWPVLVWMEAVSDRMVLSPEYHAMLVMACAN